MDIYYFLYNSSRKKNSNENLVLAKFNEISRNIAEAEEFVKVREAARRGGVPLCESLGESKLKPEAARFRAQAHSRIRGFHGARVVVTSRRDNKSFRVIPSGSKLIHQ